MRKTVSTAFLSHTLTRRRFMGVSASAIATGLLLPGCSSTATAPPINPVGAVDFVAKTSDRLWAALGKKVGYQGPAIDAIEVYGLVINEERRFSFGVQPNREHVFIAIHAGGQIGWAEGNLGHNAKQEPWEQRIRRVRHLKELNGQQVGPALMSLRQRRDKWPYYTLELAEIALLDLAGKLSDRPSLELLSLPDQGACPRLLAVLDDRPDNVHAQVAAGMAAGMTTHVKVKLFGDVETDRGVIQAARQTLGRKAMLMGDANYGYRRESVPDQSITPIAEAITQLHTAGLTNIEDPANLTPSQWAELQQAVGGLGLMPDVTMRPAWKAPTQIEPGMAYGFNTHPGNMGSFVEVCALSALFKQWGTVHMIGDASLIGPGCAPWCQLAIGLGADWVEAIEKPQADRVWLDARSTTPLETDGPNIRLAQASPGWGETCEPQALLDLGAKRFEM